MIAPLMNVLQIYEIIFWFMRVASLRSWRHGMFGDLEFTAILFTSGRPSNTWGQNVKAILNLQN